MDKYGVLSGPNLDQKCIGRSDPAPSHELFLKIYIVKYSLKSVNRGGGVWRNFKCPLFC